MSGTARSRGLGLRSHRNLDVVARGGPQVGAISQAAPSRAADELTGREGSLLAQRASAVGVRARRGGGTGVVQCRSYLGFITPIAS